MSLQKITFRLLLLMPVLFSTAQTVKCDVPDGIVAAFKTGNAKELAKFFNTTIELVILDKEGIL
ncbi:MAG: DUF4783 domain-containing protein [Bacteroidales bacterium]|nr:DUF4783 domain-containing protein [Bacteroidales bacterium]